MFARVNRVVGKTAVAKPGQCLLVVGLVVAKLKAVERAVRLILCNQIEMSVEEPAADVIVGILPDIAHFDHALRLANGADLPKLQSGKEGD